MNAPAARQIIAAPMHTVLTLWAAILAHVSLGLLATEDRVMVGCLFNYKVLLLTLADVDECADPSTKCGANAACINTVGSYSCECGGGYSGLPPLCVGMLCKSLLWGVLMH